jgi:hypothetical protein
MIDPHARALPCEQGKRASTHLRQCTETYETTQGNAFTIERLMPVPYKMGIEFRYLDFKYQSKMQLLSKC